MIDAVPITNKAYNLTQLEQIMDRGEWRSWYSDTISVNRAPTYSEAFFAYFFDSLGIVYTREHVVGDYPVDIFIPHLSLCIDIDSPCYRGKGGLHSKKKIGNRKEAHLRSLGWEFFRFRWVRMPFTNNRGLTVERIDELLTYMQKLQDNIVPT